MPLTTNIPANETPHKPACLLYNDALQQGAVMFRRLFLSHPQQTGETYFQHQRVALSFALPLLGAGFAAVAHAFVPGIFQRTAGDAIRRLHQRLEQR
jgi:hypothetical protein